MKWVITFSHIEFTVSVRVQNFAEGRTGGRGVGGSSGMVHERKNRGSQITDRKISLPKVREISNKETLFNDLFLH